MARVPQVLLVGGPLYYPLYKRWQAAGYSSQGVPRTREGRRGEAVGLSLLDELYEKSASPETPGWHHDEVAACFRNGEDVITSTDWTGGFHTVPSAARALRSSLRDERVASIIHRGHRPPGAGRADVGARSVWALGEAVGEVRNPDRPVRPGYQAAEGGRVWIVPGKK